MHQLRLTRSNPPAHLPHPRSGGAVIIIVLTLLSTMVFLGFFFFGFTNQAQQAARAYAEAEDYEIEAETIIDQALEQLLVGVRAGNEESALWGNKHSILPHIVGPIDTSLRPRKDTLFSGTGIRMFEYDSNGDGTVDVVGIDYDGDGTPEVAPFSISISGGNKTYAPVSHLTNPFILNYSRVAALNSGFTMPPVRPLNDAFNSLTDTGYTHGNPFVIPDYDPSAGYTYPDLNSLFLAHDSIVNFTDTASGTTVPTRVIIPSFFRPQLMLNRRAAANGFNDVFENVATTTASLRPHREHRNMNLDFRFRRTAITAQSGNTTRIIQPFPFRVDLDMDGIANEMGVLNDAGSLSTLYELDFDSDNDGIRDSIWMDLGLQMIDLPDGRQVVPLVAFKVLDADGLLNLNVHGNLAGIHFNQPDDTSASLIIDRNGNGTLDAGDARYPLSRSNMGLSPTEINPTFAMFDDILNTLNGGALGRSIRDLGINGIQSSAITPAAARAVVASAELSFLIAGRLTSDLVPIAGRHGEENLLFDFLNNSGTTTTIPRAGLTWSDPVDDPFLSDDDLDWPTAGGIGYQASHPLLNNIRMPTSVHPLPFAGNGSNYVGQTAAGATRVKSAQNGTNPSIWPTYSGGHWHDHTSPYTPPTVGDNYNILPYTQAGFAPGDLMTAHNPGSGIQRNDLLDEDDEITVDSNFQNPADALFPPSENAALQLTDSDFKLLDESSRTRELATFNFRDSPTAAANRRRFTTDSWDRLEFTRSGLGAIRPWEFSEWAGTSFNGIPYTAGDLHFPPQFESSSSMVVADVGTDADPFRRELRQLLWTKNRVSPLGGDFTNLDATRLLPQHRLNINEILTGFDSSGNPLYRPFVPHPVFDPTDTITVPPMYHGQHVAGSGEPPGSAGAPAYNTLNPTTAAGRQAMEWWARYDRQRMARDIYTLLWTLSGGNDVLNYSQEVVDSTTDVPGTTGYEADSFFHNPSDLTTPGRKRVREMAQFAVNLVDALDSDNVITRFEYDYNLTNGWDTTGTAEIDCVYGVEAQQLAFSEVMLVVQPDRANDFSLTYHREDDLGAGGSADSDLAHQFLFIELRNTSPFPVPLDDGTWKIVRVRRGQSAGDAAFVEAAVEFRGQAGSPRNYKTVQPGANFVIGCHDGSVVNSSGVALPTAIFADIDTATAGLESVVPRSSQTLADSTAPAPVPLVDLDITSSDPNHAPFYAITQPYVSQLAASAMPTPANKYDGTALVGKERTDPASGQPHPENMEFDLVLMRRSNLNAYGLGQTAGTPPQEIWVEVDRFEVRDTNELEITNNDSTSIVAGFQGTNSSPAQPVTSFERRQPLDPRRVRNADTNVRAHTIRDINDADRHGKNFADINPGDAATVTYTLWEPHFDRPFASVMDLLSIPLYGYAGTSSSINDTTARVASDRFYFGGAVQNLAGPSDPSNPTNSPYSMVGHRTAGIRFQYPGPQLPGGTQAAPTNLAAMQPADFIHYRNRWYRFLEFIEVPDDAEGYARQRSRWKQRTPGKINLNTLRDESVLAGIIDDFTHLDPVTNFNAMTDDRLTLTNPEVTPSGAFYPNPTTEPPPQTRNWFRELLQLRDGIDPFLNAAGIGGTIPGSIGAQPFRSLSHVTASDSGDVAIDAAVRDSSIESTVLRSRPLVVDNAGTLEANFPKHGLFEARDHRDRSGKTGVGGLAENSVDFHTRNRLLAKIHNRTTNRSHVFFVWTSIGFFEAHRVSGAVAATDASTAAIQIGAQAEDIPVRRSFTVVDMSRIEEAYEDPDPADGVPGAFDFRKFILYKKLIK